MEVGLAKTKLLILKIHYSLDLFVGLLWCVWWLRWFAFADAVFAYWFTSYSLAKLKFGYHN